MEKLEEMKKLAERINELNYHYYVLDDPILSDIEYDKLYYRLVDLEKETGVVLPQSPTQRVGGQVLDGFEKKRHEVPLYSLNKVRDYDDLRAWMKDMKEQTGGTDFALEYKFDGLQMVLEYDGGHLQSAVTRGNGTIGEVVTAQVKTIHSVPLEIPFKNRLLVQGEVMITNKNLALYNKNATEKLKNARNAAAGAVRNLDPKETAKRKLDYFCYSILISQGKSFKTQKQVHDFLKEQGFQTGEYFVILDSTDQAIEEIGKIDKIKSKLDIMIDGMVLKINNIPVRDEIGYTAKFPKWAVAFKFEAQELSTMLEKVIWQVGRSGRVTPIACLEPVELAGASVRRATLNNIEDIKRKGIFEHSRVFVRRSNEVIPEVTGLAEKFDDSKEIKQPKVCPCCHKMLTQKGPLLFCTNHEGCKDQVVDRLAHFASRNAMNIDGLSDKTAGQFYDELGVRELSDLYKLTAKDLEKLDKFKDKKVQNTLNSIKNSKNIDFAQFLFALGITEVGIKTAKDLAKHFGTLESLMRASKEEIAKVRDVGDIIAQNIVDYFADQENLKEIKLLFECGVHLNEKTTQTENTALSGKTVVLTGTLPSYTRDQATALIEKAGGRTSSSVSKNTDFVLAGSEAGSKLDKAKALGIKVIDEEEFKRLIKPI